MSSILSGCTVNKGQEKANIGIVVAIEMDAVKEKYGEPRDIVNAYGYTIHIYENGNCNLYFINSGAGEINSAGATQVLLSNYNVGMVLNFGVVGALTDEIKTAQLCVVDEVIDIDFGSEGWLDLPKGQHQEYQSRIISPDRNLLDIATKLNPDLMRVRCASTNSFRNNEADKTAINAEFGADICEMEAAGIAYTCARAGVPCLMVKAISDSLTGGGAEFLTELNRVSLICFNMLDEILANI